MHYSSSKKQNWQTPDDIYELLNSIYNFELDACATKENKKCNLFYNDALTQKWLPKRTFMNPPYGRNITSKFVYKAINEVYNGVCPLCVMLIPNATETKHFQEFLKLGAKIYYPKGRISFVDPDTGKKVRGNTKGSVFVILSKLDLC